MGPSRLYFAARLISRSRHEQDVATMAPIEELTGAHLLIDGGFSA